MSRSAKIAIESNTSFNEFYQERSNNKKSLYIQIFLLGTIVAIISYFINGIAFGSIINYSILFDVLIIITGCTRVIGICIVSIIPSDEIDVIQILSGKKHKIMVKGLYLFFAVAWILNGLSLLFFYSYNLVYSVGSAIPMFLVGI